MTPGRPSDPANVVVRTSGDEKRMGKKTPPGRKAGR